MRDNYVLRSLGQADKSVGLAEGGLHYRLSKDGRTDMSEDGAKRVSEARLLLVEARKLIAKAHALAWETDLHYS